MTASIASLDVLIVDDHEPTRAIIAKMLRAAGAQRLRDAADATQALQMLAERPADLIITDQVMPDMDGAAFIAALKQDPKTAHARTVLISGFTDIDARTVGANAVLAKPIEAPALLRAIEAALA
ncbi:MAG: response regulator [Hyphomonadaceae bacterium]|nr:response regulator [Hyphomonadaceae bacterium]